MQLFSLQMLAYNIFRLLLKMTGRQKECSFIFKNIQSAQRLHKVLAKNNLKFKKIYYDDTKMF